MKKLPVKFRNTQEFLCLFVFHITFLNLYYLSSFLFKIITLVYAFYNDFDLKFLN